MTGGSTPVVRVEVEVAEVHPVEPHDWQRDWPT